MRYEIFKPEETTWRKLLAESSCGTFFHTPDWSKIICDTFPKWKNATISIEFEDGNMMVFPMLKRSVIQKIPYYWHESCLPGVYGGPILNFPVTQEHLASLNFEIGRYNNILIGGNPFSDWKPEGHFEEYKTFIQIINLSSDFEKIWKNYSKGRRHTINYAKKQGVRVREVDFLEYYQTYYEIYTAQLKRWGKNATNYYPLRLFKNLAIYAKTNPGVKLWGAFLDEKMISGIVTLYHKKHLVTWHGATLDEFYEYRPVDILYSSMIENACNSGYEIFDFTNSGGHDNVVYFKERYGAIRTPYTIYRRKDIGGTLFRGIRYLRNKFQKCPED